MHIGQFSIDAIFREDQRLMIAPPERSNRHVNIRNFCGFLKSGGDGA